MTIGAYGAPAAATARALDRYGTIKAESTALSAQLSTGLKSPTFAGLGSSAGTALRLARKLDTLASYGSNIADATLRVKAASAGLQSITTLSRTLSTSLSGTSMPTEAGRRIVGASASDGLKQAIDILNGEVAGRHVFSGRASDTEPVASFDEIMDGADGRAGLKTLIAERALADAGPDGLGRMAVSAGATTVTLGETAAGLPFGLKLAGAAATGTALSASAPAGLPATTTIGLAAQPTEGDSVEVSLLLPDGTNQIVKLVAGRSTTGDATGFAIGDTVTVTTENLRAALRSAIGSVVANVLPSASAMRTANDFFAATAANPPARVDGPPFDSATGQKPGTTADTVTWYRGDASPSPREGAPVRIGDTETIGIGLQANEAGLQTVLASFAAAASGSFPEADATSAARFTALGSRIAGALNPADGLGPVSGMSTDTATAATTLGSAASRITLTRNQAQDALDGIVGADPTEAATKLLANQTRLAATYQTTSTLAKMTLVDYL